VKLLYSNKDLLEQCDEEENVEAAAVAITSSLKRIMQ
jgi:hypothetical protein